MGKYADSPEWADITPIPQDDGENPLASIAYTDAYSEAMSYLRAVMATNEQSPRVLELTQTIIAMNPAHYTVWLYRAQVLFTLNADLRKEIEWLNPVSLKHLKNYQIWQHRQVVVDTIDSPEGEVDFINEMFEKDAKNYHVWSYRQWLVQRFGLWDKGELRAIEDMLTEDVRNNSAWNHRWYITFGRPDGDKALQDKETVQRELECVKRLYVNGQS
jgi:protein farnesyltransferase/geranylgeranyltransferase type-1 subunit alpha